MPLQELQALAKPLKRDLDALGNLGFSFGVPGGQAALRVGIDQEHGTIAGAFCFHGKMLREHRFAAATLLRVDYDDLHEFMLLCLHESMLLNFMLACKHEIRPRTSLSTQEGTKVLGESSPRGERRRFQM